VVVQISVKLKNLERVRRKQKWNMKQLKKDGMAFKKGMEDEIK